ncbi:unnamed protein product, partial [Staurois parvus]
MQIILTHFNNVDAFITFQSKGWTDNSWGPRAIGDHGAPVSLPTLKAHSIKPIKGTRDILWGPLLALGPQAVPECSNGQSAPGFILFFS